MKKEKKMELDNEKLENLSWKMVKNISSEKVALIVINKFNYFQNNGPFHEFDKKIIYEVTMFMFVLAKLSIEQLFFKKDPQLTEEEILKKASERFLNFLELYINK